MHDKLSKPRQSFRIALNSCVMCVAQSAVAVLLNSITRNRPLFVLSAGTPDSLQPGTLLLWLSSFPDPTATAPSCPPFLQPVQSVVCSRLCARPCDLELPADPNRKLLSRTTNAFRYSSVCSAGSHPFHLVPLVPTLCACRILHDPPPHYIRRIFVKKKSEVGTVLNVCHWMQFWHNSKIVIWS